MDHEKDKINVIKLKNEENESDPKVINKTTQMSIKFQLLTKTEMLKI